MSNQTKLYKRTVTEVWEYYIYADSADYAKEVDFGGEDFGECIGTVECSVVEVSEQDLKRIEARYEH